MKNKALYGLMSALFISGGLYAQTLKEIPLKKPDIHSGKPLMTALMERSSHREFDSRQLSEEHLSGLLWAACGINRQESGKRTAPSSMNFQDVQLYVLMQSGIYLYNEANHKLSLVKEGDYRAMAGKQDFVATAPVNLVLVSDYSRMEKAEEKEKEFYSAIDAGFISQNIYLYCASEGLNTVVRAYIDRENLHQIMQLKPEQHVIVSQTVGYKP
ncbi:MAG: SagB/ThcOx family dehydrogenase [Lentimicrobiaceae bacterium]|nr:SagB/ThcOx family dehydrogenase [Lentimicrobiaceae bacterium]MCO5265075.1 SagB/ThcOx family dehydrogenase [Lentimicrobium sp.]